MADEFGNDIAIGVLALTKRDFLPKTQQMPDSLSCLKMCVPEVRAVKLADRITNLQRPPISWTTEKKQKYLNEASLILKELKGTNEYLENRMELKIEAYKGYVIDSKS